MNDAYNNVILKNAKDDSQPNRLLVGTPTRGNVRMEWVMARYGQIIPCNWSLTQMLQYLTTVAPLGYLVADAQNVMVKAAVEGNFEWLLLIEDDTCPPPDAFLRLNEYMRNGDVPVVSGLYYTKSNPPEPMVYRGRGTSFFNEWKMGDKVWCDGVPTGFLLIHGDVLRLMWNESPEYMVNTTLTRRVFEHPEYLWADPETGVFTARTGTSDLNWCDRVMRDDVLRRAGWPKIGKKKYPFLIDTNLFCRHVAPDGTMYPPLSIIPNMKKPPRSASASANR